MFIDFSDTLRENQLKSPLVGHSVFRTVPRCLCSQVPHAEVSYEFRKHSSLEIYPSAQHLGIWKQSGMLFFFRTLFCYSSTRIKQQSGPLYLLLSGKDTLQVKIRKPHSIHSFSSLSAPSSGSHSMIPRKR